MELKLNGFSKLVDERVEVYDTKVCILESLMAQNQSKQRSASMKSSVNMQACDNLIKTLSLKIEQLENANFTLKLEYAALTQCAAH